MPKSLLRGGFAHLRDQGRRRLVAGRRLIAERSLHGYE
jgi:hypothetical protein